MKNITRSKLVLRSERLRMLVDGLDANVQPLATTQVSQWASCNTYSGCHTCLCLPPEPVRLDVARRDV